TYGPNGEVLTETTPSHGTRTYINSSPDHVMWSLDTLGTNQTKYWLADVNGSVYGLAKSNGDIIERQKMDAFGNTTIVGQSASNEDNLIGFQGRANLGFMNGNQVRNREYDWVSGRFLSPDPRWTVNGPDMYGFCGNDPVNRIDPMGTDWVW